ncbi:hypothetical protein JOF53_003816 [Crossiella equi]|uniref:Uncharacterized protein n=1 Tax=Crossiella equi TaxID=130796 RepID=A0ABS5AED3_9PSEU|nr:hypothetical protein [Crossiella equi]MBP2474944.1 hypothetical protein [Crossiella equi]
MTSTETLRGELATKVAGDRRCGLGIRSSRRNAVVLRNYAAVGEERSARLTWADLTELVQTGGLFDPRFTTFVATFDAVDMSGADPVLRHLWLMYGEDDRRGAADIDGYPVRDGDGALITLAGHTFQVSVINLGYPALVFTSALQFEVPVAIPGPRAAG